jgi:hypothetical protein
MSELQAMILRVTSPISESTSLRGSSVVDRNSPVLVMRSTGPLLCALPASFMNCAFQRQVRSRSSHQTVIVFCERVSRASAHKGEEAASMSDLPGRSCKLSVAADNSPNSGRSTAQSVHSSRLTQELTHMRSIILVMLVRSPVIRPWTGGRVVLSEVRSKIDHGRHLFQPS